MNNKRLKYLLFFVSVILSVLSTIYILKFSNVFVNISFISQKSVLSYFIISILFGIIYYLFLFFLIKYAYIWIKELTAVILNQPKTKILVGTIGLIIGVVIAFLISRAYTFISNTVISTILATITYVVCAYLGIMVASKRFSDFSIKFDGFINSDKHKKNNEVLKLKSKILDTSAIIDGRISEIAKTGFLEGRIYITEFVLKELRHIADSEDSLTRTKGRRGFDIIEELKNEENIEVIITDKDYPNVDEVDLKLLSFAKEMDAYVVTTDYNLNKVASLQKIKVLNVNYLSNAVKPNAIPGEVFEVEILKKGKEQSQGVAYLNDGTMIVIENGANKVGQKKTVEVTSILQTPAGRMIFAKIKE